MKILFKRFFAAAISVVMTAVNLIPLCISANGINISTEQPVISLADSQPTITNVKISSVNSQIRFLSNGIFGREKISVTVYAKDNSGNSISCIKLFSNNAEIASSSSITYNAEDDSYYAVFTLDKGEYNLSAAACVGTGEIQTMGSLYSINLSESNNYESIEKDFTAVNSDIGSHVLIEDKVPDVKVYPLHVDSYENYVLLDSVGKYSDGNFCSFTDNEKVWTNGAYDFLVNAYDENSGVYSISHKLSNLSDYITVKNSGDIQADFSVIVNGGNSVGENFISAKSEDNSGNISAAVDSVHVEIDNVSPEIVIEKAEIIEDNGISIGNYTENSWINKRVKITVSANDDGSGADRIEMSANGGNVSIDNIMHNGKKVTYTYIVEPDFMGDLSFTAYDNVNNKSKNISYGAKIDIAFPSVTSFEMNQDIDIENYGFSIKNDTIISIEAYDAEPFCSGIDFIELGVVDLNYMDGEYNYNESDIKIIASELVSVSANQTCSFTINAGFKGQIFARAVDCAGNVGKWRNIESLVNDNQEVHNESSYMNINIANAPYTDIDGNPLYDTDQTIIFNVKDYHAGINEIKWYVRTSEGVIMGSDVYSNFSADDTNGWAVQKKHSIITEASKKITVSADENNIEIGLCFTDNAGFSTDWQVQYISIDKTAPEIISFDFDDKSDKSIFNKNRTATVIVNDKNIDFSNELIDITVSDMINKDSTPYKISDWELVSSDNRETLYKVTLSFSADAEYKINFNVQDVTGKKSANAHSASFIIDKTPPDIKITYDNNNSVNDNYYNSDRKATITVTENNFDKNSVKYTLSAFSADNITKIKETDIIPSKLNWIQNPDNKTQWTAVIDFNKEGKFNLSITCIDKAGNKKTVDGEAFYIDKTPPTLEQTFTNGKQKYATNTLIVPKIIISDYNLGNEKQSAEEIDVVINKIDMNGNTGSNFKCTSSKYTPTEKNKQAVYEANYNVFADKLTSDGIYDISITVSDMAGNTVELKNLSLSINRNGSTFELVNSDAKEIVEKFEVYGIPVQEAADIEIREINVSKRVDDIVIIVTHDDKKSYILESDKYTFTEGKTADNNSGWYETIYKIDKSTFSDDGIYSVDIYTSDEVGNENSNQKSTIRFSIDHTPPSIVISGVRDNANLKESEANLRITFSDRNLYSIDSLQGDDMIIKINNDVYNFDDLHNLGADISNDEAGNIVILMNMKADKKNHKVDMSASLIDKAGNISEFKDSAITFRLSATFLMRNGWIAVIIGSVILVVLAVDIFFIVRKARNR